MYISRKAIIWGLALIILLGSGYYIWQKQPAWLQNTLSTASPGQTNATEEGSLSAPSTVALLSADQILSSVSASGNIALANEIYVTADVDGQVIDVYASVGDNVQAGEALVRLRTTDLERTAKNAELSVSAAKNQLTQASEETGAAEIAVAQANLLEAQENLADVQAGPSDEELAAARSSASAAWNNVSELQAGASQEELTQLGASLRKAEVTLADAQRAYDQIAWQGNAGASSQASDLQTATIEYESANAAYVEATAPPAASELQSALSSAQSAQASLGELENSPTPAEIAAAQAQVTDAESTLADLLAGPDAAEIESARISLEQALLDLEAAYANLDAATIRAPVDGALLTLDAIAGQKLSNNATVATMADITDLKLTIQVAEVDIAQVEVGQNAAIEISALTGQTFSGVVTSVAPAAESDSSVVTYDVTIQLTAGDLTKVRPGMTAVATIENSSAAQEGALLAPSNALHSAGGQTTVTVVRNGAAVNVPVATGSIQGEWTVITSSDLQAGDLVVGSTTAPSSESNSGFMGGRPPDGGLGGPPAGGMGGASNRGN
ncbi:MAG: efflux RND transporter periplasmic adaptor subunit [Caldilineaceae bacterium]|nr:efflux RND transporter periplasmic adaptor subunit [Caldilineaceae bacterium]